METSRIAGGAVKRQFFIRLATHEYVALALRVYLGGLFIYASMYKISYAAEFAETIASYRLAPFWAVNFSAIFLPWLELVVAILLIVGLRARVATVLIGSLLAVFTVAVLVNLLRDSPIPCGCFSSMEDPISWWTVLRDLAWLAMAVHVFCFDKAFHLENRLVSLIKRAT